MGFPVHRLRRLRATPGLRRLVSETTLAVDDLVLPLFVRPGRDVRRPISAMPGCFQFSVDQLVRECREVASLDIPAVILFGIPERKDAQGSGAFDPKGVVQTALREVKSAVPDLVVITDVCLCEYTDHGHCGLLREAGGRTEVDNDATLEALARMALSHAQAGADIVAPSDMMDGRVEAIREALDAADLVHVPIMSYAVKYASWFYGPFREAAESPPKFGDRRGYQMDVRNTDEALREAAADVEEGADVLLVKPALAYGDIIRRVKQRFGLPVAAYSVSGEFAMVEAAAARGWLDREGVIAEILTGLRRAGADLAITYWAAEAAARLTGGGKG